MKLDKLMRYDAWKACAVTPPIDLALHCLPAPEGKGTVRRYSREAEAINETWNTGQATHEDAPWVTQTHNHMLPVVKAAVSVANAR